MTRHTFKRRDGTRFELILTVDHDKLAANMAQTMCVRGKTTAKKCGGAITGTIKELPD